MKARRSYKGRSFCRLYGGKDAVWAQYIQCMHCLDEPVCRETIARLEACRRAKELSELPKYLTDSEPIIRTIALQKYKELNTFKHRLKKLFRRRR